MKVRIYGIKSYNYHARNVTAFKQWTITIWGNSWELNGLQFGITAGESPEFDDEVVARKYSRVPLYYDWHPEFEDYYGFSLAWKKYESDSDLSIYFYTT